MAMDKWYRLTPKKGKGGEGLTVLVGCFQADELEDMKAYGYQVEEVIVLTLKEYQKLKGVQP